MKRHWTLAVAAAVLASSAGAVFVAPASAAQLPETIELPEGFQGEGVATAQDGTFYAGSRVDGRIARGVLREGTERGLRRRSAVPAATGLKADERHGLLWVSGAGTGDAAVYDLETGEEVVDSRAGRRRRRSSTTSWSPVTPPTSRTASTR